jgi:hypothetical protein
VQVPVRLFQPYLGRDCFVAWLTSLSRPIHSLASPFRLSPLTQLSGLFLCFCGPGKLLIVPFKSVLLGAADATGEANLAAHRCSNFLCM